MSSQCVSASIRYFTADNDCAFRGELVASGCLLMLKEAEIYIIKWIQPVTVSCIYLT